MSMLSLIPEDKRRESARKESLESVYSSNSRLNLLTKRKRMNALTVDMSNQSLNKSSDRYVTQRVLSAKTHRLKQLQNQLADAHYHLQELSNENRVLRAIQKKQEVALQRYENSNAELPTILNSHDEELRIQQTKFKQLKHQFKEVTQKLKERDIQYQQLKDEHQHLLELSKDRNLLEREKLQAQVVDLTAKIQQQNETISTLQRRIALEAKNFRHQLQSEINKHKDTRHDLDLAICNADKLSTIIEMKEKMISNAASRVVKSPNKPAHITRQTSKSVRQNQEEFKVNQDRTNVDNSALGLLSQNSRNMCSSLSHDDDKSSSIEPLSRYARSRTNSTSTRTTPIPTRKSSKGSDEIIELAKSVQDGMADLSIFDEEIDFKNSTPDEVQKKIETLKADLLNKVKNNEEPVQRKTSALRRKSTEESIEEQIEEVERPKSRGRRHSTVSFTNETIVDETTTVVTVNDYKVGNTFQQKPKRESSATERKPSGKKPLDNYCKDIMQDIEKSSKVIDKHIKEFNSSKFDSDKLVEQLQTVDKLNDFVNAGKEIPETIFNEFNNNFQLLSEQVIETIPVAKKRSASGKRSSKPSSRGNAFGDASLSNQELLDDLLGKK